MTPKAKNTISFRCQSCNDENCQHTFEFKVFKNGGKYFVGSGPYETREDAKKIIEQTIKTLEARNNQNIA